MSQKITLAEVPVASIVYDHDTRLFPFSPRREVEQDLIDRLKRSVGETGMWQPVVVRAGTFEGIAGNHRFLARLEIAEEQGLDLEQLTIPTVLIDCDEGLAVSIALIENELRENLTRWEMVRTLLKAAERKPKVVESVFEVDGHTVEQLRFWENELDYDVEVRKRREALQARLTRQWIALINSRLSEYPDLREYFLEQLRHPNLVQVQSLDELDRAITRALLSHGVRFEIGKTWNSVPTSRCLGCRMTCDELLEALRTEEVIPRPDGTIESFCPHLRVFPLYTEQFIPAPDGTTVLETVEGEDRATYPAEACVQDGQAVRGENVLLLDGFESYCVAPDIHEPDSCFYQREKAVAQKAVEALEQQGLHAVLPAFVREREGVGEFVWQCPQREGKPCTLESCPYAGDDPPGFVAVVQSSGVWEMVCIHAECGGAAKEALLDWEAKKRQEEERRRLVALDELRRISIERTLLASPGEGIDLSTRPLLEAIESVLVPDWDTPTMFHVVLGWQVGARAQIAASLGIADCASKEVARAFRERYGELTKAPTGKTVRDMFQALRGEIVQSDDGHQRWVASLALVRTWRDRIETVEQITDTTQLIVGLSKDDITERVNQIT